MNLVFDIFPADDVRGTRLVRLTADDYLTGTMFRTELVGVGKGRLVLQADQAVVTPANFARDNYVEVFDLTLSGSYALGAFFLEEGDFAALSAREQAGRILSFGGRGELSYLSRGILGTEALSGAAGPFDQHYIDTTGQWDWGSDPATETYGGILRRIIYESALMTPDPLPEVQLVDIGWDDEVDSDAVPWPPFLGRYQIPVGTNLLQAAAELMKHGIELVANSDFEYSAYNSGGYGSDRTSATFASGKVRFEAGVNIAADLSRSIHGATDASHSIVSDRTGLSFEVVESPEYSSGDVVRYVGIDSAQDVGPEDLESLGFQVLANRRSFIDQFAFPHPTGYAPLSGLYTPGPPASAAHYWKGDYVTIHTGSSPYDADEQTIRVAAIEWNVDEAGNWLPTVELGAQYLSVSQANFSNQLTSLVSSPHTHPPNPELCRIPISSGTTRLYFTGYTAGSSPGGAGSAAAPNGITDDAGWDHVASTQEYMLTETAVAGSNGTAATSIWSSAGGHGVPFDVRMGQFFYELDGGLLDVIQAGGASIRMQATARSRYGVGISEASQDIISQMSVRVCSAAGSTIRGTALAMHTLANSSGGTKWAAQATMVNRVHPPPGATATLTAVPSAVAGDFLVVETGGRVFYNGATGGVIGHDSQSGYATDLPADEVATGSQRAYIEIVGPATSGDMPLPTVLAGDEQVGTSIRAARCDHQHAHGFLAADGTHYHDVEQVLGGGGAETLDELEDVDISTTPPADGDALVYDSTSELWLPATVGGSGSLAVEDDGTEEGSAIDRLDFAGAGVSVAVTGTEAVVTIAGGGGATALGAILTRSSTQSIPQSTATAISWTTEVLDEDSFWAVSPNPTRLTAGTSGWHVITAYTKWAATTGLHRRLIIVAGGVTVATQGIAGDSIYNDPHLSVAVTIYIAASDYVEIQAYQNQAAGGLNISDSRVEIVRLP